MTRLLELTQGQVALIDEEDWLRASAHKWHAHWQVAANAFYAKTSVAKPGGGQRTVMLHRFIIGAPSGVGVDHRNGNTLDCRKGNLRLATGVQNSRNRGKQRNSSTGFKGVSDVKRRADCMGPKWQGPKWRAHIEIQGKQKHLGRFDCPVKAARAYDRAARLHFGEFARVNFPEGGEISAECVYRERPAA